MKNKIQLYMLTGWEKCQYAITPSTSPALPLCEVQLLQIGSEPGKHQRHTRASLQICMHRTHK